ncbi:hypothetical protein COLO4_14034 [Corchorus olitorius]|uniref:Uncharacterized protein n=1 Tax=Corchorus olitorius TaxID=93759 RepID=A0A1R3JU00_9ROSI|nr:hypothetical protein COLO4_14034 [Corchorus olitorius]
MPHFFCLPFFWSTAAGLFTVVVARPMVELLLRLLTAAASSARPEPTGGGLGFFFCKSIILFL